MSGFLGLRFGDACPDDLIHNGSGLSPDIFITRLLDPGLNEQLTNAYKALISAKGRLFQPPTPSIEPAEFQLLHDGVEKPPTCPAANRSFFVHVCRGDHDPETLSDSVVGRIFEPFVLLL